MIRAHDTCADHLGNNAPPAVLNADLALLLSARAWGCPESTATDRSPWLGLEPGWRDRLLGSGEASELPGPAAALDLLRQSHRLQCRAELDRVHSSWWIRALQDESPAVRRVIATHGPPRVRAAARAALGLSAEDLHDGPPPSPEAIGWVLALWTERLVGGEPAGANDPPVIVALAGLPPPQLFRLSHAAGQAKATLASDPEGPGGGRAAGRQRDRWFLDWFRDRFGPDEAQARAWARRELERDQAARRGEPPALPGRCWSEDDRSSPGPVRALPNSLGVAACALPGRKTDPLPDALDARRQRTPSSPGGGRAPGRVASP